MKNATLRLLTVVGSAVALSVVGIAPATAAPVATSAAASARMATAFRIPNVIVKVIPNQTVTNASQKRLVLPYFSRGAGATLVSTRLTIATSRGKMLYPSTTRANLSPGTYKVTQNIRYTYRQSGKTLSRTVSRTQNLTIGVAKPTPAPTVTIQALANSTTSSPTSVRNIRPVYSVGKGARPIWARVKVTSGNRVITNSAASVNLTPGTYQVTSTVHYTYVQGGKTLEKTVTRTQALTITYNKPVVTQPTATDAGFAQGVINAYNAERAKAGLQPLKTSATLDQYNTRWVNSKFTSKEDITKAVQNVRFFNKAQSGYTTYHTAASYFDWQMKTGDATYSNIHTDFFNSISVVRKSINGWNYVGVLVGYIE